MPKFSFRTKLTSVIMLVIFAFGAAATFFVYKNSQAYLTENILENIKFLTADKSDDIRVTLGHATSLVQSLAMREDVVDYMTGPIDIQKDSILHELHHFNASGDYSAVYLMDEDGLTVASTEPDFVNKNYAFREYFKKAMKGESGSLMALGVTSNELGYYFSSPILNQGEVVGVAVMKMKPSALYRNTGLEGTVAGMNYMLADQNGVVMHSNVGSKIMKSLGVLSGGTLTKIKNENRYGQQHIAPLDYDELLALLGSSDEVQVRLIHDEHDQSSEIVSLAPVEGAPFYLLLEDEEMDHTDSARNNAYILAMFIIFGVLAAMVVIFVALTKFTRPLESLSEQARDMAKGNYHQVTLKHTGDEFETLAQALNQLSSKLKETTSKVETQIKARVEKLTKLNENMVGRELRMKELKEENAALKEKLAEKNNQQTKTKSKKNSKKKQSKNKKSNDQRKA